MPGQGEHPEREVQRELRVTTPLMHGPDVAELQDSINKVLDGFKLRGKLNEDGEYGQESLRLTEKSGFALGFSHDDVDRIHGGHVSKQFQEWIRNPSSRSDFQKDRVKQRVAILKDREQRSNAGADAAVAYARSVLGTTESPPSSNRGPLIDMWTRALGLTPPVFWCGCFAGFCVVEKGGAKIPTPSRLTYHGYIAADARAGQNGLRAVSAYDAEPGDLVSYSFQHIGLIVAKTASGRLHTIEGNTSSGSSGSQSNGGGVFERKDRTVGTVLAVARPDY